MGHPEKQLENLPGPMLFRAIRLLGRAPAQQDKRRFSGIMVVQAVRGCQEFGMSNEVTIRAVADHMHIAQSTASRLVNDAVDAGYVETTSSRTDRRSMALQMTATGRQLLDDSVTYQTKVYEQATHGWPEEDKQAFDRLLVTFCHQLIEVL